MFRLNVDGDYSFAHLLLKCVLDTVANVVSACDAHIPRHHQVEINESDSSRMTCTYIVRLERAGTLFGNKSSDALLYLG